MTRQQAVSTARATPNGAAATMRERVMLSVVVIAALVFRLAWSAWSEAEPTFENDGGYYFHLARSIADGEGMRSPFEVPTAYLAPAYPALLAATFKVFGAELAAAQLANALLWASATAAVYVLARQSLAERASLLAAAMFGLMPSLIIASAVTFPDPMMIVLLCIILITFHRAIEGPHRWWFAATCGVASGAAILTHAQFLAFPLVLLAYAAIRHRDAAPVALVIVAIAAGIITPSLARNASEIGTAGPVSTNGGVAFWVGHHDGATGHREFPAELRDATFVEGDPVASERRANTEGYRDGLAFAVRHPLDTLAVTPKKLFWFLGDDEEWMELNEAHGVEAFLGPPGRDYWFTLSNVYYYFFMTLALTGIAMLWRSLDRALTLCLLFAAYWTTMALIFYGDARGHTMLIPVLAPFAAVAMLTVVRHLRIGEEPAP